MIMTEYMAQTTTTMELFFIFLCFKNTMKREIKNAIAGCVNSIRRINFSIKCPFRITIAETFWVFANGIEWMDGTSGFMFAIRKH